MKGGLFQMDKKKVLILILSIAIIISILVLSVFLLTKGDKPKDNLYCT